jgi:RNA polymerase sigma-70 factor, ECF subfamily
MSTTPRFEELIDRHHDELCAYLYRLLGAARRSDVSLDVEDLVQEVFLRAYQSYENLQRDSNHRAWLYKIATNCAFSRLRQTQQRRETILKLKNSPIEVHSSVASDNSNGTLRALVSELPNRQRACVTLRFLQDLDYPEIAAILSCSEESVRANVYQAIRRLRAALEMTR